MDTGSFFLMFGNSVLYCYIIINCQFYIFEVEFVEIFVIYQCIKQGVYTGNGCKWVFLQFFYKVWYIMWVSD